jgi:hypothetical protein
MIHRSKRLHIYALKGGLMKKLCYTTVAILISVAVIVSFVSGCALVEPKADITITSTEVDVYAADDWYMDIYFTIVNTGLYDIVYYDITFEVTCTDATLVNDEYWGSSLLIGESYSDVFRIDTLSKEPETARVSNVVLEMD